MPLFSIFLLTALLIVVTLLSKYIYIVHQAEVIIIERFGRYNRTLTAGIHVLVPFIETPRRILWSHIRLRDDDRYYRYTKVLERIDLREAVYDFPKQNVITKDNVTTEINAVVYYHITDPKAAVYEVYDLPEAIEKLAQTALRNVVGSMDLDETLVSRDQINTRLRLTLDDAAQKWGVNVTRVELQEVNPPADIKLAMEKQMRAERDRRAIILEAEGAKQSAILRAEGEQEARIREAHGIAQAQIITAQGEAQAIELIKNSLPGGDPIPYLVALQYMKILPTMTEGKDNKLIIIPYEASALMGSLSSMKKVFKDLE